MEKQDVPPLHEPGQRVDDVLTGDFVNGCEDMGRLEDGDLAQQKRLVTVDDPRRLGGHLRRVVGQIADDVAGVEERRILSAQESSFTASVQAFSPASWSSSEDTGRVT